METIKDYLHLYIGCKVYDTFNDVTIELTPMSYAGYTQSRWYKDEDSQIKPLLRPLIDISPFEWLDIDALFPSDEILRKGQMECLNYNEEVEMLRATGEITKYLLSRHFDLFGLIEKGLALDETKIKSLDNKT